MRELLKEICMKKSIWGQYRAKRGMEQKILKTKVNLE